MQQAKLLSLVALVAWGCARPAQSAPTPAPAAPPSTAPRQEGPASRTATGPGAVSAPNADPFPSTYRPFASRVTLIRNATVMTAAGPTIANGSVLLRDGK